MIQWTYISYDNDTWWVLHTPVFILVNTIMNIYEKFSKQYSITSGSADSTGRPNWYQTFMTKLDLSLWRIYDIQQRICSSNEMFMNALFVCNL